MQQASGRPLTPRSISPADDPPAHVERITLFLLAACGVLAVAAFTTPLWGRSDDPMPLAAWVQRVSGLSLIAAGVLALRWRSARRIAKLLLLSAAFYYVPFLAASHSDIVFTLAMASRGAWVSVGNHFVLAFPEGRLRTPLERGLVFTGYGWMAVGSVLTNAFIGRESTGCATCPNNLLLIRDDPALQQLVLYPAGLIPAALAVMAIVLLASRWRRATRPERRVLTPVFVAFAVNVVTTFAAYLSAALRAAELVPPEAMTALFIIQPAMVALIPAGVVIGLVRGVLARSSIGNLLVRIGEGRTSAEIDRDVAWALGDPTARIVYRKGQQGRLTDAKGRPVDETSTATPVGETGGVLVAIAHDLAVSEHHQELLEAVVAATRLALENQRLETEVQLSQRLPQGLADRRLAEGAALGQTEMLTISVLMSDIRDYSGLAERAELVRLTTQLQEHRAAMNRVISAHGGTVMQYAGDSVFSVFGAPLPFADHADQAVLAAVEMQRSQAALNERWHEAGWPVFELGIGVTTGQVAAALLGSDEHVEYSVVGDVVNLSQRLQAWAARREIVISDATFSALRGDIQAEQLPPAHVKGRTSLVTAYRILSNGDALATDTTTAGAFVG